MGRAWLELHHCERDWFNEEKLDKIFSTKSFRRFVEDHEGLHKNPHETLEERNYWEGDWPIPVEPVVEKEQ